MLTILFYIAATIAVIATFMAITRHHAVHALLYLVVSFLAIAVIFYLAGAPFIAALEVIIYAGAIMTLFIFVIMMLNLGPATVNQEKEWLVPGIWVGPSVLTILLFVQFLLIILTTKPNGITPAEIEPKEVGILLFTEYLLGVELVGFLLLAGIVGAYHFGKQDKKPLHRYLEMDKKND
jgi:NADH-quinone oxidoreductase subunit J